MAFDTAKEVKTAGRSGAGAHGRPRSPDPLWSRRGLPCRRIFSHPGCGTTLHCASAKGALDRFRVADPSWDPFKIRTARPFSSGVEKTAAIRVGRLLEVSVDAGYRTLPAVDDLFDAASAEVSKLSQPQHVVVTVDFRRCPLLSSEASDHLLLRMERTNARTARAAILVLPSACTTLLQVTRIVKLGNHLYRRAFQDPGPLIAWLRECLTPHEVGRLGEILEAFRGQD